MLIKFLSYTRLKIDKPTGKVSVTCLRYQGFMDTKITLIDEN